VISIILAHFLLSEKEGYDLAVEKFAVTYTNCGFIGVPLGYALYGSIGVIYATVFVATFHLFCWTHGISLLDRTGFQPKKLINPCLIAVCGGILCFMFQLKIPTHIAFAMNSIADMNTPLAMILSGAIMAQLNFKDTLKKGRMFFVVALRLIVSSALFALILRFIPIDEQMRVVAAVTAACPAGAMTITMAILYGRDDYYATELFGMTTILSIITIPLCMMIAG
jgi:predicted permease